MYYTDAHIRPRVNTTSTRIYGSDEQRRQSFRKSARRLSTGNTRAMVGRYQYPHLAVRLPLELKYL